MIKASSARTNQTDLPFLPLLYKHTHRRTAPASAGAVRRFGSGRGIFTKYSHLVHDFALFVGYDKRVPGRYMKNFLFSLFTTHTKQNLRHERPEVLFFDSCWAGRFRSAERAGGFAIAPGTPSQPLLLEMDFDQTNIVTSLRRGATAFAP